MTDLVHTLEDEIDVFSASTRPKDHAKILQRKDMLIILQGLRENLPPSLEFFHYTASQEQRPTSSLRSAFEGRVRTAFYKHIFADKAAQQNLRAMGIPQHKIDKCKEDGERPCIAPGVFYDVTIDHIIELQYSNSNNLNNLCILPDYVHQLKSRLHTLQIGRERPFVDIISFRPVRFRDKPLTYVPFIPPGFRPMVFGANIPRRWTSALLNLPPTP